MTASQQIINDVLPKIQIVTTGTQTVFDANFTANVASDIKVYKREVGVLADDATQLVSSADYTVSFVGSQQFVRVTFSVGIPTDYIVTIIRDTPSDRLNLYTNTNFVPSMLNQDIGLLTLVEQQNQLYNELAAPHYNLSESLNTPNTIDMILPKLGPGEVWRKNDDNTAIEAVTIDIDDIPAPSNAYYILRSPEAALPNSQSLNTLGDGLLKQTVSGSIATLAKAINATDYWAPGDALTRTQPPTVDSDVVNKLYADSIASGFNFLKPVVAASTGNFTSTYDNGASGIGATLTATSNGAFTLDGQSGVLNARYLMKDQSNTFENGIYDLTQVGDGSNPAILTRSSDFDTPSEIQPNTLVSVSLGTVNEETIWRETQEVTSIGSDPILFNQFGINPSDVVTISGNQTITGDKEFTGLTEVPTPSTSTEAANKGYVDNALLGDLTPNSIEFTSTAGIIGTDTNDDADAGSVGELISSTVLAGSAVGVLNNTAFNITSIVLTPGDWDVWGTVQLLPNVTTTTSQLIGWTSTTSATLAIPPNQGSWHQITGISVPAGTAIGLSTGTRRYSVAVNTTVYLSTFVTFATSTMAAYGYIAGRRRR